jgi:hypothetical protein
MSEISAIIQMSDGMYEQNNDTVLRAELADYQHQFAVALLHDSSSYFLGKFIDKQSTQMTLNDNYLSTCIDLVNPYQNCPAASNQSHFLRSSQTPPRKGFGGNAFEICMWY